MRNFISMKSLLLLSAFAFAITVAPCLQASSTASDRDHKTTSRESLKRFDCGYDPRGAEDAMHNHSMNSLRLKRREGISAQSATRTAPPVKDIDDTTVIEDDGSVIISPSKFDLKNSSLVFTPDEGGYRVEAGDVGFNRDYGSRIGFFYGVDGRPDNPNNGYYDIIVRGPWFPFYGNYYDTFYIGTNGYITFGQPDTNARISPASLAAESPRIAPLWSDLSVSTEGNIYYNRFDGYHLITWEGAPELPYGGKSTFQVVMHDDGRIAFVYKKVKARSALVGISPGNSIEARAIDFSEPPAEVMPGPFFESFSRQKRLDLPALMRAFYTAHEDLFDAAIIWTDFSYDNGLGVAHSFNVRNAIRGIGLRIFDRGSVYGSPGELSTLITMGNEVDWPADPNANASGLFSALAIMSHEVGHRWLSYVRFDAEHDIKDDLLGRDNSHWSFLVDTRTNNEGTFSSLMEGNAWRDNNNGSFTTIQTAANHFSRLDQYLMGLRAAEDVGEIRYLVVDAQAKQILHDRSPLAGFLLNAVSKTTNVGQIAEREGPRVPDAANSPRQFRIAFILLVEQGREPSDATINKIARYRDSLVNYFHIATDRRGAINISLKP
jgi:hypothetical protein